MNGASRVWVLRGAPALTAVLALCGLGIAGYLSYTHYAHQSVACGALGGSCETVQTSKYAELMGVPVALLGGLLYLVLLAVAVRWLVAGPYLVAPAAWGLALGGVLFSAYLTYLELFVINAICAWCVGSALVLTAMLLVTSAALPGALALSDEAEAEEEGEGAAAGGPAATMG